MSNISHYLKLIETTKQAILNIVAFMNVYKNDMDTYKLLVNEYLKLCSSIHTYTNLIQDEVRQMEMKASNILNKL
jgi:hypothetical protein